MHIWEIVKEMWPLSMCRRRTVNFGDLESGISDGFNVAKSTFHKIENTVIVSPRMSSTPYPYEMPRDDSGFVDSKGIIELDKSFEYKLQNSVETISKSKMTSPETHVVSDTDIQLGIKHDDTSKDFLESALTLNAIKERTTQNVDSTEDYTVAENVNIVIGPALNALDEFDLDLNNKTDPKVEDEKTVTVVNDLKLDIDGDFVAAEEVVPAVKTFVDIMLSDESLASKSEETEDSNESSQPQSINPTISIYASTPRRQVDDEANRTFEEEDDIFEDNSVSDLKFTFSAPVNPTVEQKAANEEVKMPPIVENENGITSPTNETVSTTQIEFQRQKSTSSEQERKARQRRLQMPLMYRMYESVSEDVRGTIRGPCEENFRPEEASKTLRQALSGIQTDDKAMINILLAHTNFQRQKIVAAYTGMFHRNLADDIEEEAGGFFLDATLALLQPAHVYSARILHHALSGRSASRTIAVEIGLTSSASQLKVIRDAYFNEYHVSFEKDLSLKVEGVFGKMLQLILLRTRDSDAEIDMEQTDNLVEQMIKIEIDDLGRNLELFQNFFASQSMSQVRVFLDRYDARMSSTKVSNETISESSKNRDFESIIRKSVNIHSEVRQLLLMYSKIARNMQLYFAEQLHQAISGTRADHSAITRILVMRSEIDLHDICDEYKRKYGKHLVFDLQMTCSGEFLRLLNLLINPIENGDDVFD